MKHLIPTILELNDTIRHLQQQLAAEREKRERLTLSWTEQLAASQAAMKEAIEQPYHVDAYRILEEALNGDTTALDAAHTDYDLLRDDYRAIADSNQQLRSQLAAAEVKIQATLKLPSTTVDGVGYIRASRVERLLANTDTAALDAAIAEAQKPFATANLRLVDALTWCAEKFGRYAVIENALGQVNALAKVKEK